MSSAMADKDTGVPVHFDCVTSRIAFGEKLEKGELVVYIGGGRFGIICSGKSNEESSNGSAKGQGKVFHSDSATGNDSFIRKIIEWESKDKRADWRSAICDHYSVI
jgi:hypothetical protein